MTKQQALRLFLACKGEVEGALAGRRYFSEVGKGLSCLGQLRTGLQPRFYAPLEWVGVVGESPVSFQAANGGAPPVGWGRTSRGLHTYRAGRWLLTWGHPGDAPYHR